jgi:L-threonylcarbamoyladenylate synthase
LQDGGVIALPTDTVYGLAADPRTPTAIDRIYALKGRPSEKALPLLVAAPEQARDVADVDARAEAVMARFWPGGLTLVLHIRGGTETVALRMPDHEVPLAIIRAFGAPLAVTSANRSGEPSCTNAAAVLEQLPTGYGVLIDAGPSPGGSDSTVLDLAHDAPRLLRAGAVPARALEPLVGPLS